jgi:hypothetical protein
MHEDKTRNRNDNSAYNLAVLRHMALNLMQPDRSWVWLRSKFDPPLGRTGSWPSCFHLFEKWHKGKM